MSILTWDGYTLASDQLANDNQVMFPITKVFVHLGTIVGLIGPLSDMSKLRAWLEAGRKPADFPTGLSNDATLVIVSKQRGLIRYAGPNPYPHVHGFEKCAFGSGREFAYGALHHGATAVQAVEAAIYYSPHCGGKAISYNLGDLSCP